MVLLDHGKVGEVLADLHLGQWMISCIAIFQCFFVVVFLIWDGLPAFFLSFWCYLGKKVNLYFFLNISIRESTNIQCNDQLMWRIIFIDFEKLN